MTCFTEMQKAMDSYYQTGKIKKSVHQQTNCRYCADDAGKYNHCAWCGATFQSYMELITHMDGQDKRAG